MNLQRSGVTLDEAIFFVFPATFDLPLAIVEPLVRDVKILKNIGADANETLKKNRWTFCLRGMGLALCFEVRSKAYSNCATTMLPW